MIIFEVALPIHFCSCVILAEYNKLLFNDLIDGLPTGEEIYSLVSTVVYREWMIS